MAQLHRHPRRSRHRPAQLWRQRRSHQRRVVHGRRHGHDDLRLGHIPLASTEYQDEGPGRVRRQIRPLRIGGGAVGGRGGEFCAEGNGNVRTWWKENDDRQPGAMSKLPYKLLERSIGRIGCLRAGLDTAFVLLSFYYDLYILQW